MYGHLNRPRSLSHAKLPGNTLLLRLGLSLLNTQTQLTLRHRRPMLGQKLQPGWNSNRSDNSDNHNDHKQLYHRETTLSASADRRSIFQSFLLRQRHRIGGSTRSLSSQKIFSQVST